jgi:hypothetical protein
MRKLNWLKKLASNKSESALKKLDLDGGMKEGKGLEEAVGQSITRITKNGHGGHCAKRRQTQKAHNVNTICICVVGTTKQKQLRGEGHGNGREWRGRGRGFRLGLG